METRLLPLWNFFASTLLYLHLSNSLFWTHSIIQSCKMLYCNPNLNINPTIQEVVLIVTTTVMYQLQEIKPRHRSGGR